MKYWIFLSMFVAVSCTKYETIEDDPNYIRLIGVWKNIGGDHDIIVEFNANGEIITEKSFLRKVIWVPKDIHVEKTNFYSTNGILWDHYTIYTYKKKGAGNVTNALILNPTSDTMRYVTQYVIHDTLVSSNTLMTKN